MRGLGAPRGVGHGMGEALPGGFRAVPGPLQVDAAQSLLGLYRRGRDLCAAACLQQQSGGGLR
jgi:hypothetical protein